MRKKLFGLPVFLWILIVLLGLFFVYGLGRREGFYTTLSSNTTCSSRGGGSIGCTKNSDGSSTGCTWNKLTNSCM